MLDIKPLESEDESPDLSVGIVTIDNVPAEQSFVIETPETPLDKTRKWLAFALVGLFGLGMVMYFAGIMSGWADVEQLNPLLLSTGPLVGAAIGFYFGDRRSP